MLQFVIQKTEYFFISNRARLSKNFIGPGFLKMLPGWIGPGLLAKNIGGPDWAFYKFFRAGSGRAYSPKTICGRAGLSKNVTGLNRAVKYRPVQTFNI
jgi:hypothetical protein